MGVSRRNYAARRGVSEAAVRKAIATGRITTLADGTIDPARADSEWGARTDPAQQRGQQVPKEAIRAVANTLRDAGADPSGTDATGGGSYFLRARTTNEVLKAQTAKVRLAKMKSEVIDRARATALVFALARQECDAWTNWPARSAALMAAELGVDPASMQKVLEKHVRAHLTELAEVKPDFR